MSQFLVLSTLLRRRIKGQDQHSIDQLVGIFFVYFLDGVEFLRRHVGAGEMKTQFEFGRGNWHGANSVGYGYPYRAGSGEENQRELASCGGAWRPSAGWCRCKLRMTPVPHSHNNRRGSDAVHVLWKNGLPLRVTVRLIVMWKAVAVARMVLSALTSNVPSSRRRT